MKTIIRFALAAATLASSVAAGHAAHAGITPAPGTNPSFLTNPVDVLGTGKAYSQSWTPVDFDAKRDTAIGSTFASLAGSLGSISGGRAGADANVTAKLGATAYANPPPLPGFGGSMGVRASADLGAYVNVTLGSFNPGFNYSPGAFIDVSYVTPMTVFCRTCTKTPYYHEWIQTRGMKGNVSDVLNTTQSDPLAVSRHFYQFGDASLPPFDYDFGFGSAHFIIVPTAEVAATAAASLNPTGGQASLDAGAIAKIDMVGSAGGTALGAMAQIYATLLDGKAFSDPSFLGSTAAQMHAGANIGASTGVLWGNRLCGGVTASADIESVGAYSASAYHWETVNYGAIFAPVSNDGFSWVPAPYSHTECVPF